MSANAALELELALSISGEQTVPDIALALIDEMEMDRGEQSRYPVTAPLADS